MHFDIPQLSLLRLASLLAPLLSGVGCRRATLNSTRVGGKNGIENVGAGIEEVLRDSDALGITLANQGHRRGEKLLEGDCDELAHLVEPAGEGLGELEDGGLGVVAGNGYGEVVNGNVLLGRAADGDLGEDMLEEEVCVNDMGGLPYLLAGWRRALINDALLTECDP